MFRSPGFDYDSTAGDDYEMTAQVAGYAMLGLEVQ
jgi:hypothetical protein